YGPDLARQIEIAQQIKGIFEKTDGVVDVDWYVEDDQKKIVFDVDKEKAAYSGISTDSVSKTLNIILDGMDAGLAHIEKDKEPVELYLRATLSERTSIDDLTQVSLISPRGIPVPLSELVNVKEGVQDKPLYEKTLRRVVYVTG